MVDNRNRENSGFSRTNRVQLTMVTNRLLRHALKTSALLAVILLPIEQSLAATCCCCTSHASVKQLASSSHRSCCSKTADSGAERSCCRQGSSESGSKPCHCPTGCCGKYVPQAVDPTTTIVSTTDDASVPVVVSTVVDAQDAAADLLSITASPSPISGSQRCTLLCRYRR